MTSSDTFDRTMVRVQDPGVAVDFTFQANYTLGGTMVGLALNLTTN